MMVQNLNCKKCHCTVHKIVYDQKAVAFLYRHSGAVQAKLPVVSTSLEIFEAGGRVRKSIRIDRFRVMLYGMVQYRLMGNPSRTSVFDDTLNLSM
jgi:hypothetical protein